MTSILMRSLAPLLLCPAGGAALASDVPHGLHEFGAVAVAPDGTMVASIEWDQPSDPAAKPTSHVVLRRSDGSSQPRTVQLPCSGPECRASSLAFAPDGDLAFVLKSGNDGERAIERVPRDGTVPRTILRMKGTLVDLRFAPDGTLAVLATVGAHKEVGATAAAASLSGEIGTEEDEQRIATVRDGRLDFHSPPGLYVYQYDIRTDAGGGGHFVGTAAPGNGDDHWWIAKLYAFDRGSARVLYAPPRTEQLADPVLSRDGSTVFFIGGIMSDFSSTGGDAFRLPLSGGTPVDLTSGMHASITHLATRCGGDPPIGSALAGADNELLRFDGAGATPSVVWSGRSSIRVGWDDGFSCGGGIVAASMQSFAEAPELEAGPPGHWRALTAMNRGAVAPIDARSITWRNDGFDLQGWLITPKPALAGKRPMIVEVHGGPSAAWTPEFQTPDGDALFLTRAGYDVFLPNPRGSFGQGEAFTRANVRDFGYGDLRDILSGIDAAEHAAPVDDARLGLTGYSYGGYMTMRAVTQTGRFKAAVAGAGVSDWLSYYGENGIDTWMLPFFGNTVYADPAVYARSSPINFITRVRTPVFEYVGSADVECPMPQTEEFYHALHTLGVPTEFVVYPGQGHGMSDPKDWADASRRTLAWFDRYLKAADAKGRS